MECAAAGQNYGALLIAVDHYAFVERIDNASIRAVFDRHDGVVDPVAIDRAEQIVDGGAGAELGRRPELHARGEVREVLPRDVKALMKDLQTRSAAASAK